MSLKRLDPVHLKHAIGKRLADFEARRARSKRRAQAQDWLSRNADRLKVNVGCGQVRFNGWVNLDFDPASVADITWDVADGLPFADQSCKFIYSEHFLEHLSVDVGSRFLRDCYRSLEKGGVLRIGMPCLYETVRQYYENDWADKPWLKKYGFEWIKTRAEFINVVFREWGHQWLYDREELDRRLRDAGFTEISNAAWGESRYPELWNRETREETLLIAEAVR